MGGHPAPVLTTDRLVLRGFVAEDFDASYAYHQDEPVYRFFGDRPIGREELWRRSLAAVGGWTVNGIGGWIVERREDAAILGNIGLFDARRGLGWDGESELGYVFGAAHHGQGYAAEACRAALAWHDAHRGGVVHAMVNPDNTPSVALARRLGFFDNRSIEFDGVPHLLLTRPAP